MSKILLGCFVLSLSSCQGAFESNLFTVIDNPTLPATSDLSNASTAAVADLLSSDKVLESLKADDAARKALTDNLAVKMTEGTAESKTEAANLYLKLQLEGTGALAATNKMIETFLPALKGGDLADLTVPAELQKALASVFGTDPGAVADTLEGLQNMVTALKVLNANSALGENGDSVMAAPLATVVDIMLKSANDSATGTQDLVDFITGNSTELTSFSIPTMQNSLTELTTAFDGTDLAADSPYAYMNGVVDLIPLGGI